MPTATSVGVEAEHAKGERRCYGRKGALLAKASWSQAHLTLTSVLKRNKHRAFIL